MTPPSATPPAPSAKTYREDEVQAMLEEMEVPE